MEEPRTTSAPPRRGHGGPMGMARGGEKAKDLIGTWKKLLGYCRRYRVALVVALLCAVLGTVLTLAGPDQLSDMTDTITAGIAPDQAMLETVTDTVSQTLTDNLEAVTQAISAGLGDQGPAHPEGGGHPGLPGLHPRREAGLPGDPGRPGGGHRPQPAAGPPPRPAGGDAGGPPLPGDRPRRHPGPQDQVPLLTTLGQLDPEDPAALAGALTDLPAEAQAALFTDVAVEAPPLGRTSRPCWTCSPTWTAATPTPSWPPSTACRPRCITWSNPPSTWTPWWASACSWWPCTPSATSSPPCRGWIMATITQRVSREMRSDISHKINRLPMWYYNRTTTGDVLSRVTNDVDTIGQSLNQSIGGLLSAVVLLLGSLVMMLLTNVWMTLTAVVASLLGFALMFAIMGKSQKYFRRQQKHLGQLNGHIEEIYTGHTVVKAYNGEAPRPGPVRRDERQPLQQQLQGPVPVRLDDAPL